MRNTGFIVSDLFALKSTENLLNILLLTEICEKEAQYLLLYVHTLFSKYSEVNLYNESPASQQNIKLHLHVQIPSDIM